jgi:hypothetical protein
MGPTASLDVKTSFTLEPEPRSLFTPRSNNKGTVSGRPPVLAASILPPCTATADWLAGGPDTLMPPACCGLHISLQGRNKRCLQRNYEPALKSKKESYWKLLFPLPVFSEVSCYSVRRLSSLEIIIKVP